jgi:hypothetical protein
MGMRNPAQARQCFAASDPPRERPVVLQVACESCLGSRRQRSSSNGWPQSLARGQPDVPMCARGRDGREWKKPRWEGSNRGFLEGYLAETEGFEPSMRLYTPYSLSRGAPSATRSRFLEGRLCPNRSSSAGRLVQVEGAVQSAHGELHVLLVDHDGSLDLAG